MIRLRRTTRCGLLGDRAQRSRSVRLITRSLRSSIPVAQSISTTALWALCPLATKDADQRTNFAGTTPIQIVALLTNGRYRGIERGVAQARHLSLN